MDDKTKATQAAVPNQAAAEAQQTQCEQRHYAGGNAMLDAEIKAGEMQGEKPIVEDAIATNIAGNTEADQPTDAKVFTTTGDYPVDASQLEKDYTPPPITQAQDAPDANTQIERSIQ